MDLITIIQNTLLLGVIFFTLVIGISYLLSRRSKNKRAKSVPIKNDRRKYNSAYVERYQRTAQKPSNVYPLRSESSRSQTSHKRPLREERKSIVSAQSRKETGNGKLKSFNGDRFTSRPRYNTQPRLKVINENLPGNKNYQNNSNSNQYNVQRGNYVSGNFYG
jgi:hypothetical protein